LRCKRNAELSLPIPIHRNPRKGIRNELRKVSTIKNG
jgi:hypothetical protein